MKTRLKIILLIVTISITLSFMSHTYSRYVVNTTSNVELTFSKWQILVNNQDISNNTTTKLDISPIIEKNDNIKDNTFAPSSKGYFDIIINPSNVDLSFNYKIDLKVLNENLPDVLISKYAILDETYTEDQELTLTQIENSTITGTLDYNRETEIFSFKPFTVRIYFEWYEGENENQDDEADTNIAIDAQTNNTKLIIKAILTFEQKL